ncbi:nucleotide-binding protein [Streptomyces platensis]|uniref:nucleotide-binding protein n=1 Tax=Streptomyces platensis TaxID=58346 RepID=UPI002ED58E8A|nr:nucleotide-binding protein [Streptomyces platensis]
MFESTFVRAIDDARIAECISQLSNLSGQSREIVTQALRDHVLMPNSGYLNPELADKIPRYEESITAVSATKELYLRITSEHFRELDDALRRIQAECRDKQAAASRLRAEAERERSRQAISSYDQINSPPSRARLRTLFWRSPDPATPYEKKQYDYQRALEDLQRRHRAGGEVAAERHRVELAMENQMREADEVSTVIESELSNLGEQVEAEIRDYAVNWLNDEISRSREKTSQAQEESGDVTGVKVDAKGQRAECIFIGHGQSHSWRELKDFITDRLGLPYEEFNRISPAGVTTVARLVELLNSSAFAFLIMTAEDETRDGAVRARQNVIHEAGLFQGRLGFNRAIVMLEEGCEEFSNIHGLSQIRFPKGDLAAKFEEVRRVLEREGLLARAGATPMGSKTRPERGTRNAP